MGEATTAPVKVAAMAIAKNFIFDDKKEMLN
jgi:hypothetical protein